MTECRFYLRYGCAPVMHAFAHTDEGKPRHDPKPDLCVEIPPRYWHFSLDEAIAFFERGQKPRIRVRLMDRPREVVRG